MRSWLVLLLLSLATASWGNGLHILLKAELAQFLISRSWAQTTPVKTVTPWPWADTWPVARLRYAGHEVYVLAGAHGTSLAFGPGHMDGTVLPGEAGVSVVAGHRDTHFDFLEQMTAGQTITVESPDRNWHLYEISSVEIHDAQQSPEFAYDSSQDQLILVTCYPFDGLAAMDPGGSLRYIVKAERKAWGQGWGETPTLGGR